MDEGNNTMLIIGAIATIVGIVAALLKIYSDNKTQIRKAAEVEQRTKNEIYNNKIKVERLEKDVDKLEVQITSNNSNLLQKFSQMELRIEAKFDKLQETLIDILKEK